MSINELDILDNYEKELLNSFKNLTMFNNVKEISKDCFNHWLKNELKSIVLKSIEKDIDFNKLGDEILRIAIEKEEQETLKSFEQYEYSFNISKHFLCYFENNDLSNLNIIDLEKLEIFGRKYKDYRYMNYNTVYFEVEDFRQCEITNLQSDCVEMFFNRVKK